MNKDNLSFDEIMKLAKAGESKKPEDLLKAVQNRMPSDKMNELQKVLGDKKAIETLLKSEQAQQLLNRLRNGK